MTLYVVNAWTRKSKRGGGYADGDLSKYDVIVDNLETAKRHFEVMKSEFKCEAQAGYFGAVELFIPQIDEYGQLSTYPGGGDDHEYIMLYRKKHTGEIVNIG